MSKNEVDLIHFDRVTAVASDGGLVVPAAKYSRVAIVGAFEMIGGMEAFAKWAKDNQGEFYTKLFGKVIGKEPEATKGDAIDDLLDVLDAEAEDVTDAEFEEGDEDDELPDTLRDRVTEAAERYASSESG